MSKTPVKAALERLEIEGFITVSPQSGILVRDLTLDELTERCTKFVWRWKDSRCVQWRVD